MISVPLDWFVFLYLFVFLGGILLIWSAFEMYWRRVERRNRARHLHCPLCGMNFGRERGAGANSGAEARPLLAECPRCGHRVEIPARS